MCNVHTHEFALRWVLNILDTHQSLQNTNQNSGFMTFWDQLPLDKEVFILSSLLCLVIPLKKIIFNPILQCEGQLSTSCELAKLTESYSEVFSLHTIRFQSCTYP